MTRAVAMGISLVLVVGSATTFAEAQQQGRRVQFIGDSITMNMALRPYHQYPTLVGRRLRDVMVQNVGTPGATMADTGGYKGWSSHRSVMNILSGMYEPSAVVILLGTNDWYRARGVDGFAVAYRQFLAAISVRTRIVCITPLWRADEGVNAAGDTLEDYRAAVREACAAHQVLEGPAGIPPEERYYIDGLHPTAMGNHLLARAVAKALAVEP